MYVITNTLDLNSSIFYFTSVANFSSFFLVSTLYRSRTRFIQVIILFLSITYDVYQTLKKCLLLVVHGNENSK